MIRANFCAHGKLVVAWGTYIQGGGVFYIPSNFYAKMLQNVHDEQRRLAASHTLSKPRRHDTLHTIPPKSQQGPRRMPPQVDVVVVFRAASKRTLPSKEQTRKDAAKTERQYMALIDTLSRAGLKAVGRRGENQDQLLVLVSCPADLLVRLVHCERSVSLALPCNEYRTNFLFICAHGFFIVILTFYTAFPCRSCLLRKQTSTPLRFPPQIAYGSYTII